MSFVSPPYNLLFISRMDWADLPVNLIDATPDPVLSLNTLVGGFPTGYRFTVKVPGSIRFPRAVLPQFVSLIGVKSSEEYAYIALNFDLANAVTLTVAAVDESGATDPGGGGDSEAHIAGTVTIDGAPAARTVIVLSENPSGREVLATGASAPDGSFDISYFDWDGPVIALALDDYGAAYSAETPLNLGTVIHPTTPNGYVFAVTEAGTTGVTEPAWSTSGSTTSGSVTFAPQPYYRPVAWGPHEGEPVEP